MATVAAFPGSPIHHAYGAFPLLAATRRVLIRILIGPLLLELETGPADAADSVQKIHVVVLVVLVLGSYATSLYGKAVQTLP